MPRKSGYSVPQVRQFKDDQIRQASDTQRLKQAERAEELLSELDAHKSYRLLELCHRIEASPIDVAAKTVVSGEDALHDFRLLIEDLSGGVAIPADSVGEPVLTVQDVSRRFNVSTKTVDRWRNRGLVSRRFLLSNRKRIGFLKSSVDRFASRHPEEVRRGSQFSQISGSEREQIIDRARQLALEGRPLSALTQQLASEFGRSPETIRLLVQNYNRQNKQKSVVSSESKRLTDETKQQIYRRFRQGESLASLAKAVGRPLASIKRTINEVRGRHIFEQPIDFMYNKCFEDPDAEQTILGPPPEAPRPKASSRRPSALPAYLASLYEVPLLNKQQEVYYFRKMNYLKFRASRLRDEVDQKRPRSKDLQRIEDLLDKSAEVRNLLIRRNLRLVVAIAKKSGKPDANFFELVSDGNVSLMRAIDKFDYSRGFKLSTYATWAIKKNFARTIPAEFKQQDRFRTGNDEMFDFSQDHGSNPYEQERTNHLQRDALTRLLKQLQGRDRQIIVYRFGLDRSVEPQTLEQIGVRLGVSKERIRQLETRALNQLREIANQQPLDLPGI